MDAVTLIVVCLVIGAVIGALAMCHRPAAPKRRTEQTYPTRIARYHGKPTRGDANDWAAHDLD